jgi:hypothetical protein
MGYRQSHLELLLALAGAISPAVHAPGNPPVDFAGNIAPIFERHCIRCHQPANKQGELSLATFADLAEGGYVVPGEPEESHLLQVVSFVDDQKPMMPKEGEPLSTTDVELLREWISQGADWPDSIVVRERSKADRSWWSLQPLSTIEPPMDGIPSDWAANPIDRFIYSRLSAANLQPSPPADRRTLIRRLTFDLTGLPPTPQAIEAFEQDSSPDAYERLVDRLLDSPHFGEQWGRHWLDVVRFGESTGFEVNHIIDNAWPYRDYVIKSLNADKPFDRLVIEHLAGDAVAPGDPDTEVALTFLVCGPADIVGNQDAVQAAQIRADTIDEIIRTAGEAFLGLSVGCARCHDHKFDPISQQDYYRLYATFAGVHHDDRVVATDARKRARELALTPLEAEKKKLLEEKAARENGSGQSDDELANRLAVLDHQIASIPALPLLRVGRFEQPPGPQFVFVRGDAQRKGDPVTAASMSTLTNVTAGFELNGDAPEQARRLALARWIVAADNPLTPRVLVNRLWHYHFGTGIVATPSDFGFMGQRPSHPELLDWLARQLVEGGWRMKQLHKQIVMSQTYRQSGANRPDASKVDSDSRLLWRFPPRRLAAEEVRDTILEIAGVLDTRHGGPGFRLYRYTRDNVATYTPLDDFGPETYRRAVYHQNVRASHIDVLSDFDAPDCAYSTARRTPTTSPGQSLVLMNHSFTMQMAAAFADRLTKEAGLDRLQGQIERAFQLALGRPPDGEEFAAARNLAEQHGLRAFCRALLNSSEMIYID